MTTEHAEAFLFNPSIFEARENCSWESPEKGLRMNAHYIAGPEPGESRETWLQSLQQYREQARAGGIRRYIRLRYDGNRAFIRAVTPITKILRLQPGDNILFTISAARREGSGKIGIAFDYIDPASGRRTGGSAFQAVMELPEDGAWHTIDREVAVPDSAPPGQWIRPIIGMDQTLDEHPGRIDIRSITIGLDDMDRMLMLSRYLKGVIRPGIQRCLYDRKDQQWAATAFTGHFTFLYDRDFYDPEKGYTIDDFLRDGKERFGGYDTVLLWGAYPRIGVDSRNQFDFYRDMPGGLEGLRKVADQLHAAGVRVFIAYLPWDQETRREDSRDELLLARLVEAIDADGVYLDTLGETSLLLRHSLDSTRPGVVLTSELHPPIEQLSLMNQSWAQAFEDPIPPGLLHLKWLEPRHMQQQIRRWNRSRQKEIETAFFNGSGMVVWENIFGAYNPWNEEDCRLWRRAAAILHAFAPEFTSDAWDPFYPALYEDLHAHHWPGSPTTIFTLYNLGEPIERGRLLRWTLPAHISLDQIHVVDLWRRRPVLYEINEAGEVQVWGDIDRLGCIAVSAGEDPRIDALLNTGLPDPDMDAAHRNARDIRTPKALLPAPAAAPPAGMIPIPGGVVAMTISHDLREGDGYPDPRLLEDSRKSFPEEEPDREHLHHHYTVTLKPYYIDEAQVTNRQYADFLEATQYRPRHPENFLKHWPDGKLPEALADYPVVYIDLDDARAYAAWAGKRLPAEAEWQRAAQGDDGRAWPWGNDFDPSRCNPGANPLPARSLPEGKSPFGCYHMSGNVWEWTESVRDDGHTRFCILRGGSGYRAQGSDRYAAGGPQRCDQHARFLLMWPGLDRCATIGFRCVADKQE